MYAGLKIHCTVAGLEVSDNPFLAVVSLLAFVVFIESLISTSFDIKANERYLVYRKIEDPISWRRFLVQPITMRKRS